MTVEIHVKGVVFTVDDEDAYLASYRWHLQMKSNGSLYARRSVPGASIYMHRQVIGARRGQIVDHINGDSQNNSRANLRFCTAAQNAMNSRRRVTNRSGVKGVYRDQGKWRAEIWLGRKSYKLGRHETIEAAAEAYRKAALELHGDFARFDESPR